MPLRELNVVAVALGHTSALRGGVHCSSLLGHLHIEESEEIFLIAIHKSLFVFVNLTHPLLLILDLSAHLLGIDLGLRGLLLLPLLDKFLPGLSHEVMETTFFKLLKLNFLHHLVPDLVVLFVDHNTPVLGGVKHFVNLFMEFLELNASKSHQLLLFLLGQCFDLSDI